jgi:hypothetical protein
VNAINASRKYKKEMASRYYKTKQEGLFGITKMRE